MDTQIQFELRHIVLRQPQKKSSGTEREPFVSLNRGKVLQSQQPERNISFTVPQFDSTSTAESIAKALANDIKGKTDLLPGFLRSNALVRTFRIIFQGLSSVDCCGPSGRATKKGNVELNNMRKVTAPSIAYIATLVRFALDSASTFASGGHHGTFNYHAFYTSIVTLLRMKEFRDSLLTWWNQRALIPNLFISYPEQVDYNETVHA
ncbi:hypothetical protein Clacol_000065 [Clathrus columnatus]|uniref:Uncharacterized protein n=1 Tax=Clathrus columnatus TaxID=1419009 RepID=A0AAV4ZZQ9_9AGAM|nr:hypothetical protein Clacol_000065 [Clathrus columnatus]